MNQNPKIWNLSFENITNSEAQTVETFLDARADDADSFRWIPIDLSKWAASTAYSVGDIVQVTGCAPSGINTANATVSAVSGPDVINGVQSGTVTLNYGDANLAATDAVGEIRRLVKVAVRGSGKTHISEVQIVGDF